MAVKTHSPKKATQLEPNRYAAFIGDLLDGTLKADKLIETRQGGKLVLTYNEIP
jgi:hypothetical protein